jgi:hypothetical protein
MVSLLGFRTSPADLEEVLVPYRVCRGGILLPFALSPSKGGMFMVRQAHHERKFGYENLKMVNLPNGDYLCIEGEDAPREVWLRLCIKWVRCLWYSPRRYAYRRIIDRLVVATAKAQGFYEKPETVRVQKCLGVAG